MTTTTAAATGSTADDDNEDASIFLQKLQQLQLSHSSPPPPPPSVSFVSSLVQDYRRIVSVGEECIHATELSDLLLRKGRGSRSRQQLAVTTRNDENDTDDTDRKKSEENDDTDDTDENAAIGFQLYDGFEPSGRMHIAQGIFKARNVNKCTYHGQSGGTFIFWIADWFALMKYVFMMCLLCCCCFYCYYNYYYIYYCYIYY
jgi:hypothetical protein